MATFSRRCNKILYHPLLQVHYNHSVSSLRSAQSSLNLHTIINSTSIQSKNGKRITAINQSNLIRPCAFSSYMTEDDNTIKKYKEVIKSFSFQVPSFGGKVTASSPLDITVSKFQGCDIKTDSTSPPDQLTFQSFRRIFRSDQQILRTITI